MQNIILNTHWEQIGNGNKSERTKEIKELVDAIRQMRSITQDRYIFASHGKHLLPINPEKYYYALDSLNENMNLSNMDENQNHRYVQITELLKIISEELTRRHPPPLPIPRLVRQYNEPTDILF